MFIVFINLIFSDSSFFLFTVSSIKSKSKKSKTGSSKKTEEKQKDDGGMNLIDMALKFAKQLNLKIDFNEIMKLIENLNISLPDLNDLPKAEL